MGNWDRTLGIASIVIGLAGLFAGYLQGSHAWAYAGGFAMIVLIVAAYAVQRRMSQAAISVDFQKFTVAFANDHSAATATKEYEFKVHRNGLSEWVHRNISADGEISGFTWEAQPIPPGDIVKRCNDLEVTARNPYPWPVGSKLRGTLTYVLKNSFPAAVEYVQYTADMPTKLVILCVKFPPTRPCTHAYVQRRAGGVNETLTNFVTKDPGGRWLQVEIRKPKGGHEYTLFWHW